MNTFYIYLGAISSIYFISNGTNKVVNSSFFTLIMEPGMLYMVEKIFLEGVTFDIVYNETFH